MMLMESLLARIRVLLSGNRLPHPRILMHAFVLDTRLSVQVA